MVNSTVQMIEDSVSPDDIRLSSIQMKYWRPIHSELMTHRVFSRNARSSRAVPVATLLKEEMFVPRFGMNQPGMQSEIAAPPDLQAKWAREWEDLAGITRDYVRRWSEEKMHKQHANRPLEWFGWIDVLVTSTDWENFFALRLDPGAQPELQYLANQIHMAMASSKPRKLQPGEWHLPYVLQEERQLIELEEQQKLSVARCARLSYRPFDGNADMESELKRYESLVVNRPVHASPAEHQATPDQVTDADGEFSFPDWTQPELHGNFYGWVQYRKTLPHEQVKDKHYGG